ncbi:MAG: carbonic anhydrase [Bacteroidetes bacterium RIFCSPLOWO2_12_FULL_31_6]|nr:MAG: carbonic anhydrase [Bacteroidetes bacterium RIFCSPLOWO2_12_FULL_31_6]
MKTEFYTKIIQNNKNWVTKKLEFDADYFKKLENQQQPPLLWIGCSDSRVPANEIIGAEPGDVFVHRNIANMVIHTDMSMLSVLDYAVNILKVQHIIVCGHYNCGGINAAMSNQHIGLIDNWIRHIKDVYRFHHEELDIIKDEKEKFNRFVELNVIEQVHDLAKTSIVQAAWDNKQPLSIHGWVYGVGSGIIKDLGVNFSNDDDLSDVFQLSFK